MARAVLSVWTHSLMGIKAILVNKDASWSSDRRGRRSALYSIEVAGLIIPTAGSW